jgi:DNA (cytosine-5)-methyltransferase 1
VTGRPRLLDLFCGAGGAAMGYHRAGFEVTGIDIKAMKRYPFEFHQADALDVLDALAGGDADWLVPGLGWFDAIHASPPCQDHSVTQNFTSRRHGSGWMLAATRELLDSAGLPWVIENVPGAPMRADFKLCGCMFNLPRLKRERWFETSWHGFDLRAPCQHLEPVITVAGHDVPSHQRKFGRSITLDERKAAMGIDWMGRDELGQAIPPAYTEYIGQQLMAALKAVA